MFQTACQCFSDRNIRCSAFGRNESCNRRVPVVHYIDHILESFSYFTLTHRGDVEIIHFWMIHAFHDSLECVSDFMSKVICEVVTRIATLD